MNLPLYFVNVSSLVWLYSSRTYELWLKFGNSGEEIACIICNQIALKVKNSLVK